MQWYIMVYVRFSDGHNGWIGSYSSSYIGDSVQTTPQVSVFVESCTIAANSSNVRFAIFLPQLQTTCGQLCVRGILCAFITCSVFVAVDKHSWLPPPPPNPTPLHFAAILFYGFFTIPGKSQLTASHTAIVASPEAITHSAPGAIPAKLHPTFKMCCSID